MTETAKTSPEDQPENRHTLSELARKVILASIGAVSLAQEEAEAFIHKLIERGEIAEKDGKSLLNDLREKRKTKIAETEEKLENRVNTILERMQVPTKSDFETLSDKLAELSQKVDQFVESES